MDWRCDDEGAERHLEDTGSVDEVFEGCARTASFRMSVIALSVVGLQGGFDGVVASAIEAKRDARGKGENVQHTFSGHL